MPQIPTSDQRRAVVSEVVQKIVKTMGVMTSRRHVDSWRELGGESRLRSTVTKMFGALENAALLLPEAVNENKEVTISSNNICKCYKNDLALVGTS